jgi:hypothetical protein
MFAYNDSNNIRNINTNNNPSMLGNMGVEERNASRNLCQRQHMDKLSEYVSKNIHEI